MSFFDRPSRLAAKMPWPMILLVACCAGPIVAQPGLGGVQFLDQNTPGVPDQNDDQDAFGEVLASGDFDGDGFDDLAVGVPQEGVFDPTFREGQVTVIRGSAAGLNPLAGAQFWNLSLGLLDGAAEQSDHIGGALAVGDWNDDGFDDLAMAAPNGAVEVDGIPVNNAGAVYLLWGSASGLTHQNHLKIARGGLGIPGLPDSGDGFGFSLARGDWNGDGHDDLAIGVDLLSVGGVPGAGGVTLLYGSESGLNASPAPGIEGKFWTRLDFALAPIQIGQFGETLSTGDFDDDGFDDLAVGAQFEDSGGVEGAGGVYVLRGTTTGLTQTNAVVLHRSMAEFWGVPDTEDNFGAAVAAGDFDGDGVDDLAIGVPNADFFTGEDSGIFYIVRGEAGIGLANADTTWVTMAMLFGLENLEIDAHLGGALTAADLNGDGIADLAVGITGAAFPNEVPGGTAAVLFGSQAGLDLDEPWVLIHDHVVPGTGTEGDRFGSGFAVGDWNGDSGLDLAVGLTGFGNLVASAGPGAVDVFYGLPGAFFADGFESGDLSGWSAVVP